MEKFIFKSYLEQSSQSLHIKRAQYVHPKMNEKMTCPWVPYPDFLNTGR